MFDYVQIANYIVYLLIDSNESVYSLYKLPMIGQYIDLVTNDRSVYILINQWYAIMTFFFIGTIKSFIETQELLSFVLSFLVTQLETVSIKLWVLLQFTVQCPLPTWLYLSISFEGSLHECAGNFIQVHHSVILFIRLYNTKLIVINSCINELSYGFATRYFGYSSFRGSAP